MSTKRKKNKTQTFMTVLEILLALCVLAIVAVWFAKTHSDPNSNSNANPDGDGQQVQASDTETSKPVSQTSSQPTDSDATDSQTSDTSSEPETSTGRPTYVSTNDTKSFDRDEWYMIFTNPWNPLPENYTFEKATVSSGGRKWTVDKRCADDLKAMLAAAKEDGVDLLICSTYRSIERQTELFNNRVQEYIKKGYSEEEAREIAATINAVPGTSEHHTGLAADIVTPSYQSLNSGFEKTDAYKWLEANCAEYGFALRYRKDKTEITGIIYEPWHYRYVGVEAATIMMEEKISFEEFLEKYGT